MMFAILFGLSMDYEVFLLSRVREEYGRSGRTSDAVADGLAKTARVITAAAAIMVAVFLAFVFSEEVFLKLLGVGMATAVLVDATVVRMVLVPALMQLLDGAHWWIPGWLDRILPRLDIAVAPALHGESEGRSLAYDRVRAAGSTVTGRVEAEDGMAAVTVEAAERDALGGLPSRSGVQPGEERER